MAGNSEADRARRGDLRAFDELVRRYRPRIVALALHLTGSESDAEDVTQEVFLGAYRSLHTFAGRSQFFTWLYRMAVNRALNAQRSRRRRPEVVLAEDPRIDRAVAVDAAGHPERVTALRHTYGRLLVALDAMPTAMRTSVVLVSLQGLSQAEAAVVQRCPAGTVAWHMHEARKRLRQALEAAPGELRQRHSTLSSALTRLLSDWGLPVPSRA